MAGSFGGPLGLADRSANLTLGTCEPRDDTWGSQLGTLTTGFTGSRRSSPSVGVRSWEASASEKSLVSFLLPAFSLGLENRLFIASLYGIFRKSLIGVSTLVGSGMLL